MGLSTHLLDSATHSNSHAKLLMCSFCSGVWLCLQRATGASWMRDPKGMLFLRLIEAVNGEACLACVPHQQILTVLEVWCITLKEMLAVLFYQSWWV